MVNEELSRRHETAISPDWSIGADRTQFRERQLEYKFDRMFTNLNEYFQTNFRQLIEQFFQQDEKRQDVSLNFTVTSREEYPEEPCPDILADQLRKFDNFTADFHHASQVRQHTVQQYLDSLKARPALQELSLGDLETIVETVQSCTHTSIADQVTVALHKMVFEVECGLLRQQNSQLIISNTQLDEWRLKLEERTLILQQQASSTRQEAERLERQLEATREDLERMEKSTLLKTKNLQSQMRLEMLKSKGLSAAKNSTSSSDTLQPHQSTESILYTEDFEPIQLLSFFRSHKEYYQGLCKREEREREQTLGREMTQVEKKDTRSGPHFKFYYTYKNIVKLLEGIADLTNNESRLSKMMPGRDSSIEIQRGQIAQLIKRNEGLAEQNKNLEETVAQLRELIFSQRTPELSVRDQGTAKDSVGLKNNSILTEQSFNRKPLKTESRSPSIQSCDDRMNSLVGKKKQLQNEFSQSERHSMQMNSKISLFGLKNNYEASQNHSHLSSHSKNLSVQSHSFDLMNPFVSQEIYPNHHLRPSSSPLRANGLNKSSISSQHSNPRLLDSNSSFIKPTALKLQNTDNQKPTDWMKGNGSKRVSLQKVAKIRSLIELGPFSSQVRSLCRIRNTSKSEMAQTIWHVDGRRLYNNRHSYAFDHILESKNSNSELFAEIEHSILKSNMVLVLQGQKGSGKTHTMFGSKDNAGLLARCISQLFLRCQTDSYQSEHLIKLALIDFSAGKLFVKENLTLNSKVLPCDPIMIQAESFFKNRKPHSHALALVTLVKSDKKTKVTSTIEMAFIEMGTEETSFNHKTDSTTSPLFAMLGKFAKGQSLGKWPNCQLTNLVSGCLQGCGGSKVPKSQALVVTTLDVHEGRPDSVHPYMQLVSNLSCTVLD